MAVFSKKKLHLIAAHGQLQSIIMQKTIGPVPLQTCRGPQPFTSALKSGKPRWTRAAPAQDRSLNGAASGAALRNIRVQTAVDAVVAPSATPSTPSVPHAAAAAPAKSPANSKAPTFQEAVAKLQEYWAQHGCIVWLPHNTEVGAGTMNPATFLRVQGPEPWNVAYVEPSIRPDDSRYGDNPNRLQRHTQFQVRASTMPGPSPTTDSTHTTPLACY